MKWIIVETCPRWSAGTWHQPAQADVSGAWHMCQLLSLHKKVRVKSHSSLPATRARFVPVKGRKPWFNICGLALFSSLDLFIFTWKVMFYERLTSSESTLGNLHAVWPRCQVKVLVSHLISSDWFQDYSCTLSFVWLFEDELFD